MSRAKTAVWVVALLIAAALAWGLWRRAARPAEEVAVAPPAVSAEAARRELEERLGAPAGPASRIVLTEGDLRQLLIAALADHPDGARLLAATRQVVADVEEGRLKLGVELDLDRVGELDLDPEQQQVAEGIEKLLRVLGQSTVYLGVEGTPEARAGKLAFGGGTRVHVGSLDLSLESFGERFSLDPEEVGGGVAFELPYFRVERVEVLRDALGLEVTAG